MKVLDLRCANGHGFEGWFGSDDDFTDQNGRGLVECPLCGDKAVSRMPSAPRLNLSGARESPAPKGAAPMPPGAAGPDASGAAGPDTPGAAGPDAHSAHWLQAVRHVLAHTEDVGERFADEARRIHYGEVAPRGIRGQTTQEEARALREEGIEFASLPIPKALKEPVQ